MVNVVLASYVYTKKPVNRLIAIWTWVFSANTPPCSHSEVVLLKDGKYQCFSSTNRGGNHGTRWEYPEKVFKYPERWVFQVKGYSDFEVKRMCDRADGILNLPYDWLGIAGFATIFGLLNSKLKWYCSEACNFVIFILHALRISPRALYKKAKEKGFVEIPYNLLPWVNV